MATYAPKVLSDGQLKSAKTTLYTVPTGKVAFVKFMRLFNTAAGNQTCRLYAKPGSTSRQFAIAVLAQEEASAIFDNDEVMVLEAGDLIEGSASSDDKVDYIITGVEKTL